MFSLEHPEKFDEKLIELEEMISKYKTILDKMDHSDLTASKLIGDQHRVLRNHVRIANTEGKIDSTAHGRLLELSQQLYDRLNAGRLN